MKFRTLIIIAALACVTPIATTAILATVAPAVASAHEKGDGPDNEAIYTGTDCGGLYRSPFGDRALWIDCHTGKEKIEERPVAGSFTRFDVYGWYVHYRNGILSYVDWRYRYTFS